MKKNNSDQLELPILSNIAYINNKNNLIDNDKSVESRKISNDVMAADADDIKVYSSISNAYFKAIAFQKG